ncbi:(d)CMP kinase [Deltaproteobacteria bacterium TL4]
MKHSNIFFIIVAIDGPTGVGKSTIAKRLAQSIKFLYVDTGAMFRCIAWKWKQQNCSQQESFLQKLVAETEIEFKPDDIIFCDQTDVSLLIRSEEISILASKISQFPTIRDSMKMQQRQLVERAKKSHNYGGSVMEGRDIGTVVFPNANFKFFVDANPDVRAKRRYDQLSGKGQFVVYEDVFDALIQRDQEDRNRPVAPLKAATDAIVIDTSTLSIEQVLEVMIKHINP